jgi:hypothetical protein
MLKSQSGLITVVLRFYCKVPYLLAVVSYKPFAIPMWACITICCPYTFAEFTFGHHPRGRDASGTCLASSIPRNIFSIVLVAIITGLLTVWVAVALLAYGPLLVAFCPVLIVPAFFTPFFAVYAPTKSLDCAVSRAGRRAKNDIKVSAAVAVYCEENGKSRGSFARDFAFLGASRSGG